MISPKTTALVGGDTLEAALEKIEAFHNWKAPGLVIGLFMVDLAVELTGPDVEADAIVETRHCLPDAVQLFTPCTIGNGWLKVLDWDKYALTLYDRFNSHGVRVWLDPEKAKAFPNLYNWYMRLVSKQDLPLDALLDTIIEAQRACLSTHPVTVTRLNTRQKKGPTALCPECNEAYPISQGTTCEACQGNRYYQLQTPDRFKSGPVLNRT